MIIRKLKKMFQVRDDDNTYTLAQFTSRGQAQAFVMTHGRFVACETGVGQECCHRHRGHTMRRISVYP